MVLRLSVEIERVDNACNEKKNAFFHFHAKMTQNMNTTVEKSGVLGPMTCFQKY
jgi:hypothetical protein